MFNKKPRKNDDFFESLGGKGGREGSSLSFLWCKSDIK
jgi:hypothetical protein